MNQDLHRDESMSRTSTLTANTTIEANTHAPLSTTASTRLQVIGNEPTFKETCYMLIKRLFGCLGNVNAIKDPNIHKRVFEFIYTKWERLAKVILIPNHHLKRNKSLISSLKDKRRSQAE